MGKKLVRRGKRQLAYRHLGFRFRFLLLPPASALASPSRGPLMSVRCDGCTTYWIWTRFFTHIFCFLTVAFSIRPFSSVCTIACATHSIFCFEGFSCSTSHSGLGPE
ncbi:hypothetical protein F4808DRAFT_409898 [Astrocystis sublimbata]|nr:hypothetical protein F4808DRAFT_409898 [Astrocystis sublimbata]